MFLLCALEYENDKQVGENFDDCSTPGAFPPPGKVCRFDLKDLVPCNWQNDYGYDEGRPCVLLKLNKVTTTCTLMCMSMSWLLHNAYYYLEFYLFKGH